MARSVGGAARVLVAAGLSALIIGALFAPVDASSAWSCLTDADPRWLAVAVGVIFVILPVRGWRAAILLGDSDRHRSIAIMGLQGVLIRVLPFRGGDLMVPLMYRRYADRAPEQILALLIWVRFVDLWVIAGAFALAAGLHATASPALAQGLAIPLFCALAAVTLAFGRWFGWAVRAVTWLSERVGLAGIGPVRWSLDKLGGARTAMRALGPARVSAVVALSVVVWTLRYTVSAFVLLAFGVDAAIEDIALAVSVAQFATALPVATVGTIGTWEAGWVAGFRLAGLGHDEALVTALVGQFLSLTVIAGLGLGCWLWLERRFRRRLR